LPVGRFDVAVEQMRRQTPAQFRQTLRRLGIVGTDGRLAPHYRANGSAVANAAAPSPTRPRPAKKPSAPSAG